MSLPRRRIAGERFERLGRGLRGGAVCGSLCSARLFGAIFAGDLARHGGRLRANDLAEELVDRDGGHGDQRHDHDILDHGLTALAQGNRLRLSPAVTGTDGFFIALFERAS